MEPMLPAAAVRTSEIKKKYRENPSQSATCLEGVSWGTENWGVKTFLNEGYRTRTFRRVISIAAHTTHAVRNNHIYTYLTEKMQNRYLQNGKVFF